jgi:hypothetical protein
MRFRNLSADLFGAESFDDVSIGEFFLMRTDPDDCIARADWAMLNVPEFEGSRLLDLEDSMLLDDALNAYIFGLYSSVILSSDSFCERLLTDAVEIRGDRKAARRGFQTVLKRVREMKILHSYLVDRIIRLHEIRNNFCHERGPDADLRIFRRALLPPFDHHEIIKRDAQEALCIMRGLVGQIERYFPRVEAPGHPAIREALLKGRRRT